MEYRCPKCNRLLYDRRRKNCGFCATDIPGELLFTEKELEKLNKERAELAEEQKQFRIRQKSDKETQRKQNRAQTITKIANVESDENC